MNKAQLTPEHSVTYAIRMKFFLLIMADFDPRPNMKFWEQLPESCNHIKQMDGIGAYDDRTGYIIYLLREDYNREELFTQLETNLKTYENTKRTIPRTT